MKFRNEKKKESRKRERQRCRTYRLEDRRPALPSGEAPPCEGLGGVSGGVSGGGRGRRRRGGKAAGGGGRSNTRGRSLEVEKRRGFYGSSLAKKPAKSPASCAHVDQSEGCSVTGWSCSLVGLGRVEMIWEVADLWLLG